MVHTNFSSDNRSEAGNVHGKMVASEESVPVSVVYVVFIDISSSPGADVIHTVFVVVAKVAKASEKVGAVPISPIKEFVIGV